jgi:hypothetical protein
MNPTILLRTISGNPERAIVLSGGAYGRLVNLPVGWTKIRVGIRYHCTDSGLNMALPRFGLGFGSGVANQLGDYSATNFIGIVTNGAWIRSATVYTLGTIGYYGAKKVGSVLTFTAADVTSSGNQVASGNGAALGAADLQVLFCDITKGSPNYTISGMVNTSAVAQNISAATFLAQMVVDPPVIAGHAYGNTPQTLAFDEVGGVLSSAQVWFDRSSIQIEIADLAVAVLS